MRTTTMRFLLLAASLAAAAPGQAFAKLKVVATLPSLAALAQEVGGDLVEVEALAAPTEDPHYVDPRPNLVLKLNRADLLVANGLELEIGWLPPLQAQARNGDVMAGGKGFLDASMFVERQEIPGGKIDRAMGDIHPGGNPHYLFDPRAGARVAQAIADRMAALDPDHAGSYAGRAAVLVASLQGFARSEAARFRALPDAQRQVVTYHKSFTYLLDWLGLKEVATVEPRPGIPTDPGHVAAVLSTLRSTSTRVILQEEYYPRSTSETLGRLAPARVVV